MKGKMNSLWKLKSQLQGRWLGLLYLYTALMGWHVLTARSISFIVASCLLLAVLGAFFLGDVLLKLLLNDKPAFDSLSFRLLSGALIGIALLYAAAVVLKLGLPLDAAVIASAVIVIWIFVRRGRWTTTLSGGGSAESTFLAIGLLAVTAWCHDLLRPIIITNNKTILPVWQDIFYHLSQIAAFVGSTGVSTIHDVQMAGVSAHPYHFASYVFPALLVTAADVSEWIAYASFLVPVGIMLTFLAAYAIAAPVLGAWPAAVGSLALLLLPDGTQQGFGNPYMSYHWLQQIAPASGYGVASAAMSFLLMIEACRSRRVWLIVASYTFVLVTLIFKAQIFVAIAFPLLIFPALFFVGLVVWQRIALFAALTTVFVAVVSFSQHLPTVPILRLDGSSLVAFSQAILSMQSEGAVKTFFSSFLPLAGAHGLVFALMLLFITFGIFPVVYICQLKRLRHEFEPIVWLFPMLIVGTFLVMAEGLAFDNRHFGSPDELLHRPFVWAYFVLVV
jgi:hypothetical protein